MSFQTEKIFLAEKELASRVPMDDEAGPQCKAESCTDPKAEGSMLCDKHLQDARRHFLDQLCLNPLDHLKRDIPLRFGWSWLYFVGCRDSGMVKIGITKKLKARMSALRNNSPVPVKLFHTICVYPDVERDMHERFSESRQHGEWFKLTDDINRCIESLKSRQVSDWIPGSGIPSIEDMIEDMALEICDGSRFDFALGCGDEKRFGQAIDALREMCLNSTQ